MVTLWEIMAGCNVGNNGSLITTTTHYRDRHASHDSGVITVNRWIKGSRQKQQRVLHYF